MDERRLTAWLITRNVLDSDAVKATLEEQIRLQRAGEQLDVLVVAERKGYLTAARVAEIRQETGFAAAGARAPVLAESQIGTVAAPPPKPWGADTKQPAPPEPPKKEWGADTKPSSGPAVPPPPPTTSKPATPPPPPPGAAVPPPPPPGAGAPPPPPGAGAPAMDERRLTAWLITHNMLPSDQIKETLEEQIRLQRSGEQLDVIAVARRKGFLTDAQVIDILEKTGYRPVQAKAPAVLASMSGITVMPRQETEEVSSAEPVAEPAPTTSAGAEGPPPAKLGSGARRRGAVRAPRRRGGDQSTLIALAFGLPIACVLLLLMVSGGGGGSTTEVADDDTPPPTAPSVTSDQFSALLDDFRQSVSRAEKVGADSEEMQRLAGLSAKLRDMASGVGQAKALERVSRRLDALLEAGGGSGVGDWSDREEARVSEAREDRAWAELTRGFERILRLCLTQPQSSVQLGAEAERGIDLRQTLADELAARVDQGAEAVLQLAASQTLYPIVGSAGYSALLREVEYFPQSLRGSERWTQWSAVIPQFEALQAKAEAYDMAMSRAERAAQRGDHAAALRVFSGDHSDDAWFAAAKSYLERPEVAQAFQRRAEQIARGEVVRDNMPVSDRDRGGEDGDATATRGDGRDWKERYLALDHTYRRGSDSEKQGAVSLLEQLLRETLQLAQGSFEDCAEIVAVFDEHDRCFRDEINLQNLRRQHHELYFNGAFARASGPHTFRSLDAWCEERGYEAWRAQLRPYLRLVAEANSRQARQREQVRRQRQEARAAVGRFAEQRLETVTEGFEDLLEWMGRQGFAPEDVKAELDETLARALERAGSPVSGGRLRRELRSLEHTATEEDTQRLRRDYERQVELVVDAVVRESLEAVEKCLAAGEPGLAFDLFGYVLLLDPNNERAHRGLGHVEVEGRWVRRFEAEKLRDGYAWDDRFGWMKFAEEARYEAGEFYDVQEGRWTSLAEANQTHSQWANPWVIRTEHFELRSSADIGKSAQIAKRLEAFYLQIFRQYDLFFMARGGAALIFGVAPSQNDPLVVNFYRDEQQFRAHANPPTGWAAGFYSGGQHASFFYDMGNAYSSVTVLQHEITHQILGETSPGGAESWLAEGAAVYLEDAFFRDGQLTLGELKDHSRVRTYKSNIRSGNEHTFESITQLKTGSQWDSGDISANYRGAGAAVYFLCHFDGGRYRGDYVEFLRDQYYRRSPSFEDTFGLSARTLNLLMQRFYDPEAQLDMGGSGEFSLETLEAAQEAFEATCDARDPDIDQISQAYAMLREALQNAPERESDRARNGAGRDLVSLRRKQAKIVEKATRDEGASGSERQQQYMELQRLRQEALAIINDTARYPDENHGAAGQHLVDEKVDALRAFWEREPEALQDPEVNRALEILEATDPWLVELEVRERNRGESAEELRRQLVRAASPAGLALTQDDLQAQEYDAKVRAYNASRTDLPEDCRDQVRILNDYREMLGLHALALDARLYQSSLKHSQWMEQTGNFSHQENTPGRVQPMDRARQEGYEGGVGENIAFGYPTAPAVHMGWYNSSGHHRNMTGRNWYQIGVGRAGTYWTQNFGTGKPDLP